MGGLVAIVGAAFTARSFRLASRGQVTDRFGKAVSQLASEKLEERLGGVYALEQVMIESPREHSPVLELLCAFVRTHCPLPESSDDRYTPPWDREQEPPFPGSYEMLRADIQAIMTVIARRPQRPEPHRPMLLRTALPTVSVRKPEFERSPRLTRIFFTASDLRSADLRGADLSGTIANYADARWAALNYAKLTRTAFHRADLRFTDLQGADFRDADLTGANLSGSDNLTAEQLSFAKIDGTTILPGSLSDDPWIARRIHECESWNVQDRCPPRTRKPT